MKVCHESASVNTYLDYWEKLNSSNLYFLVGTTNDRCYLARNHILGLSFDQQYNIRIRFDIVLLIMKQPTMDLESLIEEATVDCYDEEECRIGFLTMLQDNIQTPFEAKLSVNICLYS